MWMLIVIDSNGILWKDFFLSLTPMSYVFEILEQRTLNNNIRKQIQRQYILHDDSMIKNLLQTFLEHYKFTECMCDVLGDSFCKRLVLYTYW